MNEPKIEKVALAVAGLGALILSAAIVASLVYLLLAVGSLLAARSAFAQITAGVQLEAAIEKEQVEGDLQSAIGAYQKIAADTSAPRNVRAKALLHLAGCYEKLGRQARQVYEQIVRDFADQPAAAQARRRLASLRQQERPASPRTMTQRKIEWSRVGDMGPSDTDGQRAVYRDSAGNLFFGDLAGQSKRMIFKAKPDRAPGFIPSRDFSMVFLRFSGKPGRPSTVAVMKTDGTGYRELLRDDPQGSLFGWEDSPSDWNGELLNWSWDDRWLVGFSNHQKGGGRLWMISVTDGKRRELARVETGTFAHAAFSPDGRFIAYETAPNLINYAAPTFEKHRVFVLPTPGGEPRLVYESDFRTAQLAGTRLLDWTADGRYLAIADAPSGKLALYLLPVKNGEAAGKPTFIRYGEFEAPGYTTAAGALVYSAAKPGGLVDVYLASLDANGHPGRWQRLDLRGGGNLDPSPSFSPDGMQIAYVAKDPEQIGGEALVLRDLASGEERVLHRSNGNLDCEWAYQHPKVFCADWVDREKTDLFSVAVESGEVERLGSVSGMTLMWGLSHDDLALYLMRVRTHEGSVDSLVRWEVASRRESLVAQASGPGRVYESPSPDEQWLIRFSYPRLEIRPISGGQWKLLTSFNIPELMQSCVTPDGSWIVYHDTDSSGTDGLFRVSIAGGQPQRLGDFPNNSVEGSIGITQDGRKIMAVTWPPHQVDLWVLENFVPPAKQ
jgi:Tol biopolymer transport system component